MFNGFLKQSTASQSRLIGPFLDDTDFKTTETGLTIANTDIKLSKNAAAAVNKNSGGGTHITNGKYSVTFDATDTDTVGELDYSSVVSGALIVTGKFMVLEEAVYDASYAASAVGPALASVATEQRLSELDAGTGGKMANVVDEVLIDTSNIGANGAGLTAINLPDQTMNITGNITGNLSGSVGSLTGHTVQTGDSFAIVNGAAGLVAIDTVVDAIKVKTDSLTFTKANEVDANAQSINGAAVVGDGNATPWDGA